MTSAANPAAAQTEVVMHAGQAVSVNGQWQSVGDSNAASGVRLWTRELGQPKLSAAFAAPQDYVDLAFSAEAGKPYRLWVRSRSDNASWSNDSSFVQFDRSVNASGQAVYRIGTTSATTVSLEACGGCGISGWGWEDNGWGGMGPLIYFATSGPQRIRIQRREDGMSIDQIVLSASQYLYKSPGRAKDDSTILSPTGGASAPAPAPAPAPDGALRLTDSSATVLRGGSYADRNLSSEALLETRSSGDPTYVRRIALKFDTQNTIPAGAVINSATLTLTVAGGNAEQRTLGAYRIPATFEEAQATWNRRNSSTLWNRAGGDVAELHNTRPATSVRGSKVTFDLASFVQAAVNGAYGTSRYTRVLVTDLGGSSRGSYKQYYSDEATDASLRPVLTVSYTPGSTTSAPAPAPTPAPAPAPAPEPAPAPAPSGTGVKLRVLQWNIHHGVGTDGLYNIDRLATWMAAMTPDVVLLNEVEKYTYWGNEDQPARFKSLLQAKTGRTWYMHFSQEFGQWTSKGKGHLILSKYPLESTSHVTITPSSGLKGAGAISQATITVNNRTVNLLVSHLDPYDRAMRLTQAKDVINWAAGHAENRILAGDMNAWPDQTSIAEINKTYADSWTVAASKGTATGISGITPFGATKNGRIDYIFYSKYAPNLVVLDSKTFDTRDSRGIMPSDHRPVLTTFEVR